MLTRTETFTGKKSKR